MTEIATIDSFGRWEASVFSENTAIFKIQDKQRLFSVHFIREFIVTSIHN